MQTGKINVQTENIFPIIKKFLYSDHEIFLRELVSNAVDATQKLKTFSMKEYHSWLCLCMAVDPGHFFEDHMCSMNKISLINNI